VKILKHLKNNELDVVFREYDGQKLVISLAGRIASSFSNRLLDTKEEPGYTQFVLAPPKPRERIIVDFRELEYINSIGAAILMRFYSILKKQPTKLYLVFETDSEVAFIMETLGFFLAAKSALVWNSLETALTK